MHEEGLKVLEGSVVVYFKERGPKLRTGLRIIQTRPQH